MGNNNKGAIVFTTKFSYFVVLLLKGVHYNKTHLLIWATFGFSNLFEIRENDLVKRTERPFSVRPVVFRKCGIKTGWKSILRQISVSFALIDHLNLKKFSGHRNSESCSYLSLVIDTFNLNGFHTFNIKNVFARTYVR